MTPGTDVVRDGQFKCAVCGGIFEKAPDEEANAEAKEIWGVDKASEHPDFAIICDDCFHRRTSEEVRTMGEEYKNDARTRNE